MLISYLLIRIFTLPLQYMPYSWIHRTGKVLGRLAFHLLSNYRKRTLSNLALAKSLSLNNEQIIETAKQSFENLAINCLEYAKLKSDTNLSKTVQCLNPEIAQELHAKEQGIIFFCAHQANWEVLFLDGTTRMKGIAIGKEIKNKRLYHWINSIRQKNGGRIVSMKNAVREGLRSLKNGEFLGIVGDQGAPGSGYKSLFLGRSAWTSTSSALLAYKTNCPIIFAQIRRTDAKYQIHYSDPIWPNLHKPIEQEVVHMMDKTLSLLQESIKQSPSQWLWQHNRWKQQTLHNIYKQYRHDSICLILPPGPQFQEINPHLKTLKELYPTEFLCILTHKGNHPSIEADEIVFYEDVSETLLEDYRFKLIFNLTDYEKIKPHYLSLSALQVLNITKLKQLASFAEEDSLSDIFKRALCRRDK